MAYFPNGTDGELFEETVCKECIHYNEENGCPIFNAHLLYNYEAEGIAQKILDMLIEDKEEKNDEGYKFFTHHCKLFIKKQGGER